jgi:hypothetical protein
MPAALVHILLLTSLAAALPAPAAPAPLRERELNQRLMDSGSPYLAQHARNPVDWHVWGPEAVEKARRENKPIFVSVGYSTCYWCHVANRTLFENPAIAALLNDGFVSIKIDREQRPDLDRVFMEATRLLTGSAGWPNQLFLTPDLEPIFAGSYFPPEDDEYGRPGFPSVLRRIRDDWNERRALTIEKAKRATAQWLAALERPGAVGPISPRAWREEARRTLLAAVDAEHGGFRTDAGVKFPQAPMLAFLLAEHRTRLRPELLHAVTRALDAMAAGGIHDHAGGGFHRYAIEPTWSIPHFEKMLYDNAQLLVLYAEAHDVTGKPRYREIVRSIAAHLSRDFEAPDGAFFTALDAAAGDEEGLTYLWQREEIEAALGKADAQRFLRAFELTPVASRRPSGSLDDELRGVLRLRAGMMPPAGFDRIRSRLLAARLTRVQPARDEKRVVALNGMTVAALARSGRLLGEPAYVERARRAAEAVWNLAWSEKTGLLAHEILNGRAQGTGLLEDYAHLARGLLVLHDTGAGRHWRDRAARLMDAALREFADSDGRLRASREVVRLPVPLEDAEDYVYPSGTSTAIEVLVLLGGRERLAAAARLLHAVGGAVSAQPHRWSALLAVLARHDKEVARALPSDRPPAAAGTPPERDRRSPAPTDSASRVAVAAAVRRDARADFLEVTLQVEPGWHVNANPASFGFLVPTKLILEGASPTRVIYPPGRLLKTEFAPDALSVYDGTVTIRAEFPPASIGRGSLRARLVVQACSDTVCLLPATVDAGRH